jgi:RNase P subunit RPR2
MGRGDILICPSCDYKRRLTEAETVISYALVVACLKCGAAMQCPSNNGAKPARKRKSFLESCTLEALEEWVVT